jgi:hypothetical protein
MSEPQLLFVIVVLIWIAECALWLHPDAIAVIRTLRGWRVVAPPIHRGGERGTLTFSGVVPVVAREFIAADWLVHLELLTSPGPISVQRWANEVTLAGAPIRFASVRAAVRFESLVRMWSVASERRSALVDLARRAAFDETEILDRLGRLGRLRALPLLCAVQAAWIFAAAPLLGWVLGFARTGIPMIAGTLALDLVIAALFLFAHRRLVPEDPFGRWTGAMTMIFSPASAAAAIRYLTRPLLGDKHPAAVIGALCSRDELVRYARRSLFAGEDEEGAGVYILEYLASKGVTPADLSRVPPRHDTSCTTYCPRCEAQYVISEGTCNDCSLPLVRFSSL